MKITKNIELINLALYVQELDMLLITDVHLGQEESLHRKGFLIPKFQYVETKNAMEKILQKIHPSKILINGDLKHEFGSIMGTEWKQTLDFIDFLQQHCKELIIIKGNHDTILQPVAKKKNIKLLDYYTEKGYFITHGDKIYENLDFQQAHTIIIGNEHPAISLRNDGRKEQYKCYLVGTYKKKTLIVMPSFNVLTIGSDILSEKKLSPYLHGDISQFHVYIVEDDVYDFGILKELEKL